MQKVERQQIVLVTSGSGYLGSACIKQLLEKGYLVRTTVRSPEKQQQVIATLKAGGINSFDKLSFIKATLDEDENWELAVKNCSYVLHVASPFPASDPVDENELILPAKAGALRVLRAACDAGVKRVVLTSSFAAVGLSTDPKGHIFTEQDWTDTNSPQRAYIKSKVLAELAAWDFITNEGNGLELSVINPTAIFGPILAGNYSAAIAHVLKGLIDGHIKETPPFTLNVVDVRDVAAIHIEAMVNPQAKGERFLAGNSQAMSFYDIAALIRKERPLLAEKIPNLSPISADLYINLSTEKAKNLLGWIPRGSSESLLASLDTFFAADTL
jgi:nucleoside-diphosphate-sugar epimerase